MVTIRDVAREAQVSPSTVSLVLNGRGRVNARTRQRVVRVVEQLQYEPRGLGRPSVTGQTFNVAVLYVPRVVAQGMLSDLARQWINGIRSELTETGDHFSLFSGAENIDDDLMFQQVVEAGDVHGVILVGITPNDGYLDHVLAAGLPAVVFNRRSIHGEFSYVTIDNHGGARGAIEYLVRHGHRRLAMLHTDWGMDFAHERLIGAQVGAAKHDLVLDPLVTIEPGVAQDRLVEICQQVARSGATGVFINGDEAAVRAMQCWRDMGVQVPGDLSVVGFDDCAETIQPGLGLSSVGFDKHGMGQQAARMLRTLLNNEQGVANAGLTVATQVVERDTVAQLKHVTAAGTKATVRQQAVLEPEHEESQR